MGVVLISFGLDMSGYSSGRTTLARLVTHPDGAADAVIFKVAHLGQKFRGDDRVDALVEQERELIAACLGLGPLAVDIPIDLQGLPEPSDTQWVWQLTLRPIDYAFGALPPLADRIGAPVARFRNVMRGLEAAGSTLGTGLYETYPAACLANISFPYRGYKGCSASRDNGTWVGSVIGDASSTKITSIQDIATQLGLSGDPSLTLNDDDLDSVICALACIDVEKHSLSGLRLADLIDGKLRGKLGRHSHDIPIEPPRGYVLLANLPTQRIRVQRQVLSSMDGLRAAVEQV
jgi:hypothetical protein